jgi:hypothetical protein
MCVMAEAPPADSPQLVTCPVSLNPSTTRSAAIHLRGIISVSPEHGVPGHSGECQAVRPVARPV